LIITDPSGAMQGGATMFSSQPVLRDLVATFDGAHVAAAGDPSAGVLAVTWLTAHSLSPSDPTGGWALFSCH
jgi:hypothetical protein